MMATESQHESMNSVRTPLYGSPSTMIPPFYTDRENHFFLVLL